MSTVEEIEDAVRRLSSEDRAGTASGVDARSSHRSSTSGNFSEGLRSKMTVALWSI